LNRQFLFRAPDVGKFKAEVADAFVNKRCPSARVVAHCMSVQDKDKEDASFYRGFMEDCNACIILGLDSFEARKVQLRPQPQTPNPKLLHLPTSRANASCALTRRSGCAQRCATSHANATTKARVPRQQNPELPATQLRTTKQKAQTCNN
jgi:hypothetical protein